MSESMVTVTATKDGNSLSVNYDFGADLAGLQAIVSDDIIYSNAIKHMIVTLQRNMRSMILAGKTQEEAQAFADSWKPGVVSRSAKVVTATDVTKMFSKMSTEEKAAFLKELQAAE